MLINPNCAKRYYFRTLLPNALHKYVSHTINVVRESIPGNSLHKRRVIWRINILYGFSNLIYEEKLFKTWPQIYYFIIDLFAHIDKTRTQYTVSCLPIWNNIRSLICVYTINADETLYTLYLTIGATSMSERFTILKIK